MKLPFVSAVSVLVCIGIVAGRHPGMLVPPLDKGDEFAIEAAGAINTTGSAFFTQILDHDNPSKGTFKQKYWYNFQYWAGPGSPIVFFTPGEIAAAPYGAYLTNVTLTGRFAQELRGAVIMIEHRYWGDSSPYDDLTAETLQLLTLHQAIQDFVHFAKTVDLPFDTNHSSNADKAPWVFTGGSYSGALTAWTESMSPGTFWAYHASSAPVEAIDDYWQYFVPVQEGMPKNCSKDVNFVIEYMDNVFTHGNESEQLALKKLFGLEYLTHANDVMGVIENGPWLWQSNSFYTNYSDFFMFCDFIENVFNGTVNEQKVFNVTAGAKVPDESGVGLEKALEGYAKWTPAFVYGWCTQFGYTSNTTLECFDTYNASNLYFADRTVGNGADRQWNWMLCNEPFYYWQNGAPRDRPTLASRMLDSPYWKRQCPIFFPTTNNYTYGAALSPDNNEHQVNKHTQGWRLEDTTRLIWTNGEFDPWRTSGVSSEFRPGGPLESRPEAPVQIIPGAFHCSDLRLKNGWVNAGAQQVIDNEVAQIVKWVAEWPGTFDE